MTREEARKWVEQIVIDLDESQGDNEFYEQRADMLLELIDNERAKAVDVERRDAHWSSWDFGS